MAKPRMDPSAFVGKLLEEHDGDVLRVGIRALSEPLIETEVAGSSTPTVTSARPSARDAVRGTGCGRGTRGGTIVPAKVRPAASPATGHNNADLRSRRSLAVRLQQTGRGRLRREGLLSGGPHQNSDRIEAEGVDVIAAEHEGKGARER
jgi:hypothetical protein